MVHRGDITSAFKALNFVLPALSLLLFKLNFAVPFFKLPLKIFDSSLRIDILLLHLVFDLAKFFSLVGQAKLIC